MKYWLLIYSPANFKHDRDHLQFKTQGVPDRYKQTVMKMSPGDKVVYYIAGIQKFGATATITGRYYHDDTSLWIGEAGDETWPARCSSESDLYLFDDELIDAKKLINDLSFIKRPEHWGSYFQGSIKEIPEPDFKLIESEIKKVISERVEELPGGEQIIPLSEYKTEGDYEKAILALGLQSNSLHDRIGEMLEQIGTWMDYNTHTKHKITPDHAYELDVAWLSGKNPEIAIEVQIGGNITEAKDRLAQARKFNYRKVILVLKSSDLNRLNKLLKHELELRNWMDVWSIGAVFNMYKAGEDFFRYYRKLRESVYKDKTHLELIL